MADMGQRELGVHPTGQNFGYGLAYGAKTGNGDPTLPGPRGLARHDVHSHRRGLRQPLRRPPRRVKKKAITQVRMMASFRLPIPLSYIIRSARA